jgi:translation initiation factor IF-2
MTSEKEKNRNLQPRPPIVVVMGHVDHGKTTLLDYIRKSNIAAREAGGITQSIGAYEITLPSPPGADNPQIHQVKSQPKPAGRFGRERKITFIDTPGHEAFSKMRYYGAHIADIAILVVAADDGVKPQTKDALKYILSAKIPYIVAINKIDKPGADIEKTKADLAKNGVYLEGYGGNISWVAISAKSGQGINELLDLILLTAEVEELAADPQKTSGVVISARIDPKKGVMAGVIVENGKLEVGQFITTQSASGKIRGLEDFLGRRIKSVTPSTPTLVFGFEKMPRVGEEFFAGEYSTIPELKTETEKKNSQTNFLEKENDVLKFILKADEIASLEALEEFIKGKQKEMPIRIIESAVGNIYESDIKRAESAKAVILGFRVKVDKAGENLAKSRKIPIILSEIIYELEKAIEEYAKNFGSGNKKIFEVLKTFGNPRGKEQIIGGKVINGPIKNGEAFELWSGEKKLGKGKILNLQSQKKDVPEVATGEEAGMLVNSDEIIKPGYYLVFGN